MTENILKFPVKLCSRCEEKRTKYLVLVDEENYEFKKYFCEAHFKEVNPNGLV